MKTILIPTDFTSVSLQLIEESILFLQPEPVNIILFHAFQMPTGMQDIAGVDSKPHLQVMNERFRKGCKRIKAKYSSNVYNILFRHMYGTTVSVFKHYLRFNKVDFIIYPESCVLQSIHQRSVHPGKMIEKCGFPIISSVLPEVKIKVSSSRVTANGDLLTADIIANH